jgi:hypothetical protein
VQIPKSPVVWKKYLKVMYSLEQETGIPPGEGRGQRLESKPPSVVDAVKKLSQMDMPLNNVMVQLVKMRA